MKTPEDELDISCAPSATMFSSSPQLLLGTIELKPGGAEGLGDILFGGLLAQETKESGFWPDMVTVDGEINEFAPFGAPLVCLFAHSE